MVRCVYGNCLNNKSYVKNKKSVTGGSKVTFFSFPAAIEQCKKWVLLCSENFKNKNISLETLFKNKTYKICEKHFKKEDFVNDYNGYGHKILRKKAKPQSLTESLLASTSSVRQVVVSSTISCLLPRLNVITSDTIDGSSNKAEDSLKRLNSLIKELEDTNVALNKGINIAEGDFGTYSHIKKEVDETAILKFEDIPAEERGTNNHDCKSRKKNKNPNIITFEEITSEDTMDMNETLFSKQSEVLNNSFEEKYSSLDIDKEIKLEIIDDEIKFKSIQEQVYSFSGITSGDDCERKYEFEKINPILKREIEDDIKLEVDLSEEWDNFEKIKDEILMWDEVKAGDDHNLCDNLDVKEVNCEKLLSEVDIKVEEISGGEDPLSTPIPIQWENTLTHQISKQNQLLTSENNLDRKSVSREVNQISKIGSYEQSATSEISYDKSVYQTTQAATNNETKSFERIKSDRFFLFNCSAHEDKNNLVTKVMKKNSDKWNASITSNSSRMAIDPHKKCLAVPVDKNIVYIKLKPFKRKKKKLV